MLGGWVGLGGCWAVSASLLPTHLPHLPTFLLHAGGVDGDLKGRGFFFHVQVEGGHNGLELLLPGAAAKGGEPTAC